MWRVKAILRAWRWVLELLGNGFIWCYIAFSAYTLGRIKVVGYVCYNEPSTAILDRELGMLAGIVVVAVWLTYRDVRAFMKNRKEGEP